MPRAVADASDHWEVSTRDTGEVLAAHASVPGLELRVLGLPEDFTPEETAGWLRDIIEAARDSARNDPEPHPIPALLHHALIGLLFSHAALWNREGRRPPCSVAIASADGEIGLGWVGDAEARVELNGAPIDVQWIAVRDETGGEARAWSVEAGPRIDVRLAFGELSSGFGGHRATLEVLFPAVEPTEEEGEEREEGGTAIGAEAAEVEVGVETEPIDAGAPFVSLEQPMSAAPIELPMETEPLEAEPHGPAVGSAVAPSVEPAPVGASESPSIGVARWLERALGRARAATQEPEAREAPAGEPRGREAIASQPAARESAVPFAYDPVIPRVPEPAARAQEPEAPLVLEAGLSPPSWEVELPPGVPDRIPPTPEPYAAPGVVAHEPARLAPLSPERIPASEGVEPAPIEDPRAIRLPSAGRPIAPSSSAAAQEDAMPAEEAGSSSTSGDESVPSFLAVELPARAPAAPPRRAWPLAEEPKAKPVLTARAWWLVGGAVLALFAVGWLLGSSQGGSSSRHTNPLLGTMRALGLGGPRFDLAVRSKPSGAEVAVDGRSSGLRTPAEIDLATGDHRVTLSFPDLGAASYPVHGTKRERAQLEADLQGSLEIVSPDPEAVIAVAIDGESRGFAPLKIEGLDPGAHEVRFSGPGMASWGQTVEIRVHEQRQIFTRPLESPATGLLQIRATRSEEGEAKALQGARVWLDGQPRGTTPLTLELPRGPHSVRLAYQGEEPPVQVIDLPGGNQRFATFEFGLDTPQPRLTLRAPAQIPAEQPVVISASLENVPPADLREMWLCVRSPDGRWRRYPMSLLEAEGAGAAGAIAFPSLMLGAEGKTSYYVSALTSQGDEYFTEMQTMKAEKAKTGP